jgi:hypothetical protein
VGKLFSTKLGFADGIVQTLGKIWCPVKGIRCKDLGDNLFLFTFLQQGSAVGSFLRVKVLIDIRKPLFRGVTMEVKQGEHSFWCNFKYEFLPIFCYSCGLLGHVEKECDDKVWKEVDQ